ncbi:MAG: hypothetical protein HGA53_03205, partial [Anaerolineaceae bacterium]|nr:hypothetical protein [Anaerolineaceae bacterium]
MPGKRAITAEDLYRFELINHARISPDGKQVIFTRSRVEKKTEKKYSNLWLLSTEGTAMQYTWGDHNDSTPRWSPDGRKIAFLSNRLNKEKPTRLFIIPTDGGEAYPISNFDGEIGSFSWSPDGKKLLCKVRKTDSDVLEREQDEQKKKLGTVYRKYERVFYKLDGYGYLPHERWHLWTLDAKTGKAVQITDSLKYDENDPAWSPDGKWIAYASNHSDDPDFTPDRNEIFLQAVNGGEIKTLPAPFGDKYLLSFSPDGRWLAYYGFEGEDLHYKNQGLWIVPVDGSKPARNITANYDFHVSAWTINDMGEPEFIPPTWSRDCQTIYFQVAEHGRTLLKSIRIDGSAIMDVINEPGVVGSFSWNAD